MSGGGPWEELVSIALLGTGRRGEIPAGVVAASGLTAATAFTTEEKLLAAAAVLGAERRAGWAPRQAEVRLAPAAAEDRPEASPGATQVLELLLSELVPVPAANEIIGFWLERCARAGRRPPHRLLVPLLGRAARLPALSGLAWDALGPRGRWLATLNPAWSAIVPRAVDGAGPEELWATGSLSDRLTLLGRLRLTDPERARALVGGTFASEPARSRAEFLKLFEVALSDEDEAFLEAALDDRSDVVREVAVTLLDRLPRSRRAGRMTQRALPLLHLEGGRRPRLRVELPGPPDEPAVRDGAALGRPRGESDESWWAHQVLKAVPLQTWADRFCKPPPELVALAKGSPGLVEAWVAAALSQRDAAWAASLLEARPAASALVSVLPPDQAERAVARTLAVTPDLTVQAVAQLLTEVPAPWSLPFSAAVIGWLRHAPVRWASTARLVSVLAARLSPRVLPELEQFGQARADSAGLGEVLRRLQHALALRHTISEELR